MAARISLGAYAIKKGAYFVEVDGRVCLLLSMKRFAYLVTGIQERLHGQRRALPALWQHCT